MGLFRYDNTLCILERVIYYVYRKTKDFVIIWFGQKFTGHIPSFGCSDWTINALIIEAGVG